MADWIYYERTHTLFSIFHEGQYPQNKVSDEPQRGLYTTYLGSIVKGHNGSSVQLITCAWWFIIARGDERKKAVREKTGDGGWRGRWYGVK